MTRNDFAIVRAGIHECPMRRLHGGDPCPVCESIKAAEEALSRIAKRYQGLQRIPIPASEYVKTPEPGSRSRLIGALDAWDVLDQSLKGET